MDPVWVVTKSNDLIKAAYSLTLNEQRLLLACIAQIDARKGGLKGREFVVTARQFADLYHLPLKQAYEALHEAADRLYENDIQTFDGRYHWRIRWLSGKAVYADGRGHVRLLFSSEVVPYLEKLHTCFTQYALSAISHMSSPYAIRLYEMLMQYRSTGIALLKVDDIRQALELGASYSRFDNFRARILEPALKEIREASLEVTYAAIRQGQRIGLLRFNFPVV
jgi:plasmid replication initiation protein